MCARRAPILTRDGGTVNPLEPQYIIGKTRSGHAQTIGEIEGTKAKSNIRKLAIDEEKYMKNTDIEGSMNSMGLSTTMAFRNDPHGFLKQKHQSVRNKRHANMEKGWYGANIFKNLDNGYSNGIENERPKAYSFGQRGAGGQPFLNSNLKKEIERANSMASSSPIKERDENSFIP